MEIYETSAMVEDQGRVQVLGVPFAAGTQVEVTVSPIATDDAPAGPGGEHLIAARARMQELFARVKGFRMAPKMRREKLYDRRCLRWHKRAMRGPHAEPWRA